MDWSWIPRSNSEFLIGEINTIFEKWGKSPGELKTDLRPQSEVFVREVVQNFMDAGDDANGPQSSTIPELTFEFITLEGDDAERVSSLLGLAQLANRWAEYKSEKKNTITKGVDSEVLQGELSTFRLLVVREKNTSGMYGPWERTSQASDSKGNQIWHKMRDALYASQRDTSSSRLRGSFGEGKKAIIGASRARTIFCYTAFDPATTAEFEPEATDPTSARLIGMTYWLNYQLAGKTYTGLSVMGSDNREDQTGIPLPLRNDDAHNFVNDLSLSSIPSRVSDAGTIDRGTTYLFVDPAITAEECLESLVRNWWPAIDRKRAYFRVFADGQELSLEEEFKRRPELDPFRQLLDVSGDVDVDPDEWTRAPGPAITTSEPILATCNNTKAGRLKLSLDLRPAIGFSSRDPDNNRTLICKIRDNMVIAYDTHITSEAKDHPPFVRGIFEVEGGSHPESQQLLRETEPAVHNSWQVDKTYSSTSAANHALAVRKIIREEVNKLKDKYVKDMPYAELDLPLFREVLSVRGTSGRPPVPTPPETRSAFSLRNVSAKVEDVGQGMRKGLAESSLQLSAVAEVEEMAVQISLAWERLGDRGRWDLWIPPTRAVVETLPQGFSRDPSSGLISGLVTRSPVVFKFASDPYKELFTIRPSMTVLEANEYVESEGEGADEE